MPYRKIATKQWHVAISCGKSTRSHETWLRDIRIRYRKHEDAKPCDSSHYDDYLSHTSLSLHTKRGEVRSVGEIDDVGGSAETPPSQKIRDIVEQTIHSITNTISPGRDADITDIETFASETFRTWKPWTCAQLRTASELLDDEPASICVHEHVRDLHELRAKTRTSCASFGWQRNVKRITKSFKMSSLSQLIMILPEQSFMDALDEQVWLLRLKPVEDIELQDAPEDRCESKKRQLKKKTDAGVIASVWNSL